MKAFNLLFFTLILPTEIYTCVQYNCESCLEVGCFWLKSWSGNYFCYKKPYQNDVKYSVDSCDLETTLHWTVSTNNSTTTTSKITETTFGDGIIENSFITETSNFVPACSSYKVCQICTEKCTWIWNSTFSWCADPADPVPSGDSFVGPDSGIFCPSSPTPAPEQDSTYMTAFWALIAILLAIGGAIGVYLIWKKKCQNIQRTRSEELPFNTINMTSIV